MHEAARLTEVVRVRAPVLALLLASIMWYLYSLPKNYRALCGPS